MDCVSEDGWGQFWMHSHICHIPGYVHTYKYGFLSKNRLLSDIKRTFVDHTCII